MESNGKPGRVHLSEETASLLTGSGKAHWLEMREDKIVAKGKGELQTYWLVRSSGSAVGGSEVGDSISDDTTTTASQTTPADELSSAPQMDAKIMRLVSWNTQGLLAPLEQLAAARSFCQSQNGASEASEATTDDSTIPLDEVVDVVDIVPVYHNIEDYCDIQLDPDVEPQLEAYCSVIATLYRNHPFHNFEHASHVLMSVLKLLSRISKPKGGVEESVDLKCARSYGLACDPMVSFACLLAALVHDVDHPGVPNHVFQKESPAMSDLYGHVSVSEQNSFDLSWKLLMDDRFSKLRQAIYKTQQEKARFRMIFLNACMATDLFDEKRQRSYLDRWERTFGETKKAGKHRGNQNCDIINGTNPNNDDTHERKLRATLVMEDLIRASNISHAMQHFQVFRKWNIKLFLESKNAYVSGRTNKDPAEFWYQQELDFFDQTVIPLARRLQATGVFGQNAAGNEYLDFALMNRREWEYRGIALVEEYQEKFEQQLLQDVA